ncbi:MAG: lasso peptide biosynthesis protein [Vicinamibacterales bacterium]
MGARLAHLPAAVARARRRIRTPGEFVLLARVLAVMLVLPLLLRLETRSMLRWLGRLGRIVTLGLRHSNADVVRMVRSCGGLHWWALQDNCVAQGLTLFALLDRRPDPLHVVFGVETTTTADGQVSLGRRHIWLERDGTVVFEREPLDTGRYVVQYRHAPAASTRGADGRAAYVRVLGLSSASAAVATLATLVRTKVIAVALGPAGLAVAGQLSQALLVIGWVSSLGGGPGTTRLLSESMPRADGSHAALAARTSAVVLAATATVLSVAALLFAPAGATWLFGDTGSAGWVRWLAVAVPCAGVTSLATAMLRGEGRADRIALGQAVAAIVTVPAAVILVGSGRLDRLPLLFVTIAAVQAMALALAAAPALRWFRSPGRWFRASVARGIAGYGLANAAMGIATAAAGLVIGRTYLREGLTAEAGEIAALAWFGEPLASILVSGLMASTFPAYCATAGRTAERVLSNALQVFVPAVSLALGGAGLFAAPLLWLLFGGEFRTLAGLLPLQLLATYLRCMNVMLGLPLLARGHVVVLTLLHVTSMTVGTLGATATLGGGSTYVWAWLGAATLQLLTLLTVLRLVGLSPRRADLAWLGAGFVPLLVLAGR